MPHQIQLLCQYSFFFVSVSVALFFVTPRVVYATSQKCNLLPRIFNNIIDHGQAERSFIEEGYDPVSASFLSEALLNIIPPEHLGRVTAMFVQSVRSNPLENTRAAVGLIRDLLSFDPNLSIPNGTAILSSSAITNESFSNILRAKLSPRSADRLKIDNIDTGELWELLFLSIPNNTAAQELSKAIGLTTAPATNGEIASLQSSVDRNLAALENYGNPRDWTTSQQKQFVRDYEAAATSLLQFSVISARSKRLGETNYDTLNKFLNEKINVINGYASQRGAKIFRNSAGASQFHQADVSLFLVRTRGI